MFQIPTSDPGYLPTAQAFEITLKSEELLIDKDLTIDGGGQTIEIQRPPVFGGAKFRIFHITAGNVTLSHLNIVHGDAADSADPTGGGIHNSGNLTVRDCNVLFNDGANSGGGLNNAAGSALVDRCMFFGNHANNGAAIINFAALTVTNSTFSGNETVAGNGGAINNSGTSLTVSNCTISANTSGGTGGGIATGGSAPHVANSIIAANTTKNGATSVDVFGPFTSDGYNFIGVVNDQTSGFGNPGSHDQTGSNATPANAMLGPLQDNGGFTQTMKPRNSSPLIDKGNSTGTTVDQRGAPRPVDRSGVANIGDGSDIGALEKGQEQWPKSGNTLTVTNLAEHDDIECTMDDCTLREAIEIGNFLVTNASTGPMTIGFAHGLSGVIPNTQVSTGLQLTQALTIQGPGARVLTVSGSGTRVFDISTSAVVTISGLTISDGFVTQGNGGAITNSGELTLQDCLIYKSVVTGNDPAGFGGGIYSAKGATLTLNRCTVLSNTAGSYGGGVYTDGVFNATNCTFYDNSGLRGGGIIARAAAPTMTLHNCTITGNTATDGVNTPGFGGGGVYGEGGAQQHFAANCIISANKSTNDSDLRGNWTTQGHNLITNKGDSAGFSDGVSGDIVGLAAGLDSFGNNGGPTDTWSLLSTSPAVNKGDNNLAPATDQRRYKRSGTSDIGAFEFGGVAPTPTPTPKPTPTPTASPTPTPTASPSATPTATSTPTPSSQLQNLSTRKQVGAGSNVLIGGFIVAGTDDKKVLLRGLGPSLPVNAALADPILELHASDTKLLAVNDNWRSASNANQIAAILPPGKDAESAILTTLSAKPVAQGGAGYTGVLAGKGGTIGIGLLEIYDLATAAKSKLANISTRGFVGTGDDLLIGGFIPGPSGRLPIKVLVRALGPSLTAQGVAGALQDPLLELHDANGTLLTNDNWKDASNASEIKAILPPPDDRESAIITTLAPSNAGYTAVVRGANNSTGVALVEVYALH